MRAYIKPTGRRIQPFDDPVQETPVGNRPLIEWQREAVFGAGLTWVDSRPEPPYLELPDTALITASALKRFIDGAAGRDAVLVLKTSRFGKGTHYLQPGVVETEAGHRFEDIRLVYGQAEPVEVVVDPEEQTFEVPVPKHYLGTERLELGIPRHAVMTLHHWVHIIWANQLIGGIALRNTPPIKLAGRLLWAILRARSLNRWKVLGKLNQLGKGCDIHPTAVVEGSTLGAGVKVGPFARVLFSTLGDGAEVMAAAQVEGCTLGAGAVVSEQCVARFSVLYPGAVMSQLLMQMSILGRETVTAKGTVTIDLNLEQDIQAALDGKLWPTGLRALGVAYGHRCKIGTGFFIACGRAIPNDSFVVRDPRTILSRVPAGQAGRMLIADGHRARPLSLGLKDGG